MRSRGSTTFFLARGLKNAAINTRPLRPTQFKHGNRVCLTNNPFKRAGRLRAERKKALTLPTADELLKK